MVGDITTTINQAANGADLVGDWAWDLDAAGDLTDGDDIATAVLICLFSDASADLDFTLTDGTADRRGFWCDYLRDRPLGSRLWQFCERGKKTPQTCRLIERAATDALAGMREEGIITACTAKAVILNQSGIELTVSVQLPGGAWWTNSFGLRPSG